MKKKKFFKIMGIIVLVALNIILFTVVLISVSITIKNIKAGNIKTNQNKKEMNMEGPVSITEIIKNLFKPK